jgi:nucleoside-diphosphate-sugar epimerase
VRVCLFGGAGFIGRHLLRELETRGHVVTVVDHKLDESADLLRRGVASEAVKRYQPSVVVHLAAQVGRLFGEDDPDFTIRSNALMTTYAAQACAEHGATLVYASTSEAYGDQGAAVMTETGPLVIPHNLYGLTKKWGEDVCRLYNGAGGLQIMRLAMPYGPGLPAGKGRAAIVNMLDQAARCEPMPTHVGATRSWCWVGDTCRGICQMIEHGERIYRTPGVLAPGEDEGWGVYNIGRDDNETSMRDVAKLALRVVGRPWDEGLIKMIQPPDNQTVVKHISTAKIQALGWQPEVDLHEGMQLTWMAMRENS